MPGKYLEDDLSVYTESDGVVLVQFKNLLRHSDSLTHAFSTRHGGVSTGECSSLNLGLTRNDPRENVLENFRRFGKALGVSVEDMVFTNQVHGKRVLKAGIQDKGKGPVRKSDLLEVDGLITTERGVALVTFYADCVPVFLFDPVKKVIGLSHSGWRGTVTEIAGETVNRMSAEYGCCPVDLEAVIGPSIGKCCFEVGREVYEEFLRMLPWSQEFLEQTGADKWHIHLQGIIARSLENAGMKADRIGISGLCTKCNTHRFFSYRGEKGKTGSMAALLQLK